MRSLTDDAQLALLLEVTGTPKPGNVDREHEYEDLRFEHFVAGAVGAREGLALGADSEGPGVGEAFETAVEGMSHQQGGNTQFGALLLVVPLTRAAANGDLSPAGARAVVDGSTVEDAAGFYRAFDHVDVSVADPPEAMDDLDVRRGSGAVPALRERGLTLGDIMERSADGDDVAREWTEGFERSFAAADRLLELDGPVADRAATVFLERLAERPDTFVVINHDETTAEAVRQRAAAALDGDEDPAEMASEFVEEGINPGTTADITAAGLFIALRRGMDV